MFQTIQWDRLGHLQNLRYIAIQLLHALTSPVSFLHQAVAGADGSRADSEKVMITGSTGIHKDDSE